MHLNPVRTADGRTLTSLSSQDVADASRYFIPQLERNGFDRAIMVVLSDRALDDLETGSDPGASRLAAFAPKIIPALAIDFRRSDAVMRLERAHALGVSALKFHPYLQQIVPADFERAAGLAKEADRLGMFVMVCCSYGTRALGRHDGVRLTAALSESVRCPIVMSHAGGRQILDAMLVAEEASQVVLDTSFSLPYISAAASRRISPLRCASSGRRGGPTGRMRHLWRSKIRSRRCAGFSTLTGSR